MEMPVSVWFFLIGMTFVAGSIYLPSIFGGWYWPGIGIVFLGILLAFLKRGG
jgi:hypothetical protein